MTENNSLLIELRTLTSFTYEQMANLLGVSKYSIYFWLANNEIPKQYQEILNNLVQEFRQIVSEEHSDEKARLMRILDRERAKRASSSVDINRPASVYKN